MIYTMGDSHSWITFNGIPSISIHHMGPRTMKRMGYEEDKMMEETVREMKFSPNDFLILSFGEIDIRCFVKPNLIRRSNSLTSLLLNWVDRYLNHVQKLQIPAYINICILSVPPPVTFKKANTAAFPVAGTDEERSLYAKEINKLLHEGCKNRNFRFLDLYSKCIDENGMMKEEYGDSSVHVSDITFVKKFLVDSGLIGE